jgi:hypothetical protein
MATSVPPWVWILVAVLAVLGITWYTNAACPAFGKSCQSQQTQSGSAGPTSLSADQLALLQSYF